MTRFRFRGATPLLVIPAPWGRRRTRTRGGRQAASLPGENARNLGAHADPLPHASIQMTPAGLRVVQRRGSEEGDRAILLFMLLLFFFAPTKGRREPRERGIPRSTTMVLGTQCEGGCVGNR